MKTETELLFDAIEKGDASAVKGLLYGTISHLDSQGHVFQTVKSGRDPVDCHGVDPVTGDTALHVLLRAPSENIFQLVDKKDIAVLLMNKGIDMSVKNNAGFTALELAKNRPETVEEYAGKPYDNMLLKAKETFDRYYQKPPASEASVAGSGRQRQTFSHDLSSVPVQKRDFENK